VAMRCRRHRGRLLAAAVAQALLVCVVADFTSVYLCGESLPPRMVALASQRAGVSVGSGVTATQAALGCGSLLDAAVSHALVGDGLDPLPIAPRTSSLSVPVLVLGVAPVYNLPALLAPSSSPPSSAGPGGSSLLLSAHVLSKVLLGAGTWFWDDPALTALNPSLALPHQPIQVFVAEVR
jgi:hypothetical protein